MVILCLFAICASASGFVYTQLLSDEDLESESEEEVFLFDTYVEDRLDCEQTLLRWQNLAAGGREICIFATHMPDVDLGLDQNKPQSLWYINRLKGAGGYWSLYESSPAYNESVDAKEAYARVICVADLTVGSSFIMKPR